MKIRFPEYSIEPRGFRTNIRKKHRGKWYLIEVYHSYDGRNRDDHMRTFLYICYCVLQFFKIKAWMMKPHPPNGFPLVQIDPNQCDERERLLTFNKFEK